MAKSLIGKVISTKMEKTVVVEVKKDRPHPLYKKRMVTSKRFKAHNENADVKVGDMVKIEETKPISKDKHFKVSEVVK